MDARQIHKEEVRGFLQRAVAPQDWTLTVPGGSGHETYFAHSPHSDLFVKLGTAIERVSAMADLQLTPPLLAVGRLEDGTTISVQPYLPGRRPTPSDYQANLENVAPAIRKMHHNQALKAALPASEVGDYREVALATLSSLRRRWNRIREEVPREASFVDEALDQIESRLELFSGTGLVASHNDICNANWIFMPGGRVYLVDLDMMSIEDPACDLGAILWWYYPPAMRPRFLQLATEGDNRGLEQRMRTRMAMHCLSITLPREGSFDRFDPASYGEALTDFRAAVAGEENPQGYGETPSAS